MAYEQKQARSHGLTTLKEVVNVLSAASHLPPVADGALQVMDPDTGLVIAEVWWDSELETWLADLNFDPEHPED